MPDIGIPVHGVGSTWVPRSFVKYHQGNCTGLG